LGGGWLDGGGSFLIGENRLAIGGWRLVFSSYLGVLGVLAVALLVE
jgi:hypothetical protein